MLLTSKMYLSELRSFQFYLKEIGVMLHCSDQVNQRQSEWRTLKEAEQERLTLLEWKTGICRTVLYI